MMLLEKNEESDHLQCTHDWYQMPSFWKVQINIKTSGSPTERLHAGMMEQFFFSFC